MNLLTIGTDSIRKRWIPWPHGEIQSCCPLSYWWCWISNQYSSFLLSFTSLSFLFFSLFLFLIDLNPVVEILKQKIAESVVHDKFGPNGLRIFRLLILKKQLEQKIVLFLFLYLHFHLFLIFIIIIVINLIIIGFGYGNGSFKWFPCLFVWHVYQRIYSFAGSLF